ncbi:MAG: sce7726 family protein [Candidatus Hydrogenedentes bacterium]|nr:sce7726 family protein [Candidatus Hydrogenedentota bacterium]
MNQSATQLSALTRIFSSAVYQGLARKGRSALFRRLIDITGLESRCESNGTVADSFDAAFDILKRGGFRDQYIYRSALTQNILLGTHSLRSASMLSEFRAGKSRTDLVILNGTATAYEIKSERDTLVRLANQIDNYQRVFAKIYVIASDRQFDEVLNMLPIEVGVMSLSPRLKISTRRKAIETFDRICPLTIFESLRTAEAMAILKAHGIAVPEVSNTKIRSVMRAAFSDLDPKQLHTVMVRTMKQTRNLAALSELVEQVPKSLHAAALSTPIRKKDHERLTEALRLPLSSTRAWN